MMRKDKKNNKMDKMMRNKIKIKKILFQNNKKYPTRNNNQLKRSINININSLKTFSCQKFDVIYLSLISLSIFLSFYLLQIIQRSNSKSNKKSENSL